jgi:diguanylate cyclase (GGDEF)-like protein
VLFLDIDHFKKVNDTHGHQAGDEVLRRVGKLLKLAVRNIDIAARYGGEEFAIVLTETDSNAAAQMADEIRQALQAETIQFDNKVLKITGSIGVAGTDRTRIFTQSTQLTNAADRAVYAAKSAGRNCVRLFRPKPAAPAAAATSAAAAPRPGPHPQPAATR